MQHLDYTTKPSEQQTLDKIEKKNLICLIYCDKQ